MTNAELLAKIKAEIERRMKVMLDVEGLVTGVADNMRYQDYKSLLSFLSTLEESERPEPYNPVYDEAYLNEKIKKATESWKGVDVDAMLAECRGYDEEKSENLMNQDGLEEEIHNYLKIHHLHIKDGGRVVFDNDDSPNFMCDVRDIARHFAKWGAEHTPLPEDTVLFNKGVAEGKRLMMEEAVEGKVRNIIIHENGDEVHYSITYPKGKNQYSINDKVKIIIQ